MLTRKQYRVLLFIKQNPLSLDPSQDIKAFCDKKGMSDFELAENIRTLGKKELINVLYNEVL